MQLKQKSYTAVNFRLKSLGLAVTLGSLFIASGSATMIQTGQANIAGTAIVGTNTVSFTNNGIPNVYSVQQPDTGGFSGLTGGTIANNTLGTPQTQFATFVTSIGTVFFDLQGFNPGLGTSAACGSNAVGSICTPTGSPFTLVQSGVNSVSIFLVGFGISYTGTSATGSDPTVLSFSTQNTVPGTVTGVLAQVVAGGIANSYAAQFSASAVPEPASMLLIGAGLLAVGVFSKMKRAY